MSKIETLTASQEVELAVFRDKWLKIGLATGAANREIATPIIHDFYQRIGQRKPIMLYCQSPLQAQFAMNTFAQLHDQLRTPLRAQLHTQLHDQLHTPLRAQLRAPLHTQLRAPLRAPLHDQLHTQLRAQLHDQLRDQLFLFSTLFWGSLDSYWIAYYLFPQQFIKADIYPPNQLALLEQWALLAKNAFWWYPFEGICFVCDRPETICRDERGRLHNDRAASVSFADGWALYAIRGARVPEQIVSHPETITIQQIENEKNVEVRRIMIERYGSGRYLEDSGARKVHEDETGILYRRNISGDEPIVMVRVVNSTPESDGTRKVYWLEVPPTMRTAREAVAWTFDMSPDEYRLTYES